MAEIPASEIKEIFMLFDKNEDQLVSTKELGTLLRAINLNPTELELADLTKKIDPQHKGEFTLPQLESLVQARGKDPDSLQDVVGALKVFDTDHDNMLTVEEFLYAMVNMGEKMTEEEVREIIGDSEVVDGHIKIEEFAKMIMNRQWLNFKLFSNQNESLTWVVKDLWLLVVDLQIKTLEQQVSTTLLTSSARIPKSTQI